MASDHRGRELHAGKRTAQELGWRSDPYDTYVKGRTPTSGLAGAVVSGTDSYGEPKGHYTWQTHDDVSDPTSGEVDLGREKRSSVARGFNTNVRTTTGTASTPMRAMIAAEAMKNRIAEGRDLKTGRPKEPKAPKSGKKDMVGTVGPGERDVSRRLSKGLGLIK